MTETMNYQAPGSFELPCLTADFTPEDMKMLIGLAHELHEPLKDRSPLYQSGTTEILRILTGGTVDNLEALQSSVAEMYQIAMEKYDSDRTYDEPHANAIGKLWNHVSELIGPEPEYDDWPGEEDWPDEIISNPRGVKSPAIAMIEADIEMPEDQIKILHERSIMEPDDDDMSDDL